MAIEIAQNLDAINMVRAQQNVVGRSIIGGAGAVGGGNLIGQGEQTDILTSIQIISEKTFKAIKQQTDTLVKILEFDKKKDRREKEQRAEDKKEAKTGKGFIGPQKPVKIEGEDPGSPENNEKKGFGFLEFFAASSLGKSLTKIFIPIRKFIGVIAKSRIGLMFARLGPLFAASGPLAIIGGALFVLFRYSKEIAAALSPAVESLKGAFENLKPVLNFVMEIVDTVFKSAIVGLGFGFSSIANVIELVTGVIGGIFSTVGAIFSGAKAYLDGEISGMDFLKLIWEEGIKKILMAPINFLKNIGENVFELIKGLVKSLPFGIGDKIISGMKGMTKGDQSGTAGDMAGEASMTNIETPVKKTTPDSKKSLFTSSAAYGDDTSKFSDVDVSKVKTKNMDQTSSATSAVKSKIVAEKSSAPQIKKYDIDLTSPMSKIESEIQSYEDKWNFRRSNALFADTERGYYERQKQQNTMGLGRSTVYDDFKKYQSLVASQIVRTGDEFDVGMLEQASGAQFDDFFDSEGNRLDSKKLASRVGKKDIVGDTGGGSGGTVITDAKQTIVTNSNTTRQDTYVGGINTSSGDNYFDRQTGSYAT
jgi:hypothetical protein